MPTDLHSSAVRLVERLSTDVEQLWGEIEADGGSIETHSGGVFTRIKDLTLQIDTAVYAAYETPFELQRAVAEYLHWLGGARAGFDELLVATPESPAQKPGDILNTKAEKRLRRLLSDSRERELGSEELHELAGLVEKWEDAYSAGLTHGPLPLPKSKI